MKHFFLLTIGILVFITQIQAQQISKSLFNYNIDGEPVKKTEVFALLKSNDKSKKAFSDARTTGLACGIFCLTSSILSFSATTSELDQSQSGRSSESSDADLIRAAQIGLLGAAIPLAIISNLQMKKAISQFNNSSSSSHMKPHIEIEIGLLSGGIAFRF